MNVALIMTAVKLGATVANYCGVTEFNKDAQGKLVGAKVRDELTGREFLVRAKVRLPFATDASRRVSYFEQGIVNATGPYADGPSSRSTIPRTSQSFGRPQACTSRFQLTMLPPASTFLTLPPRTVG